MKKRLAFLTAVILILTCCLAARAETPLRAWAAETGKTEYSAFADELQQQLDNR